MTAPKLLVSYCSSFPRLHSSKPVVLQRKIVAFVGINILMKKSIKEEIKGVKGKGEAAEKNTRKIIKGKNTSNKCKSKAQKKKMSLARP